MTPDWQELNPVLHQDAYLSQLNRHAVQQENAIGTSERSKKSWLLGGREHVVHAVQLASPGHPDRVSSIAFLIDPALIPLLPSPSPHAVVPYVGECNFVIRQSPRIDENTMQHNETGLGMYASRFIPAGTLIVRDHPAIIAPAGAFPSEAYEEMGNALPTKRRVEMLSMANCYRRKNREEEGNLVGEMEGIMRTNGVFLDLKTPVVDQRKRTNIGKELQALLPNEVYGGVHYLINRCNHSCGPNAAVKWGQETLAMELYALRDINVDEEILHSYADCAHPREKRMQKLFNNYKFSCDCPWCDVRVDSTETMTREEKIKASDELRDALGSWIFMHPTYKKWSDDLCSPDDLVIKSHQEALSLLFVEGMEGMQLFFIEEIALCYAMLGDEVEFRKWGERAMQLSQVENKKTYSNFKSWLEDPPRKMNRWGWRKKQREEISRRWRKQIEYEEDTTDSMRFLFQSSSESDSEFED